MTGQIDELRESLRGLCPAAAAPIGKLIGRAAGAGGDGMTSPRFSGVHRYARDRKWRVVVPPKWRRQCGETVSLCWDGTRVLLYPPHARPYGGGLDLTESRVWEAQILNETGRVLVPSELRLVAGLQNEEDLAWVGLGNCGCLTTWPRALRLLTATEQLTLEVVR